jgi:hypothetical protein
MESLAHSYLAGRIDAALRVLTAAATTLHQGGDHGAALSLQNVVNALRGEPTPLSQAAEPLPGLNALVRLAGRERTDPQGMLPGEHVRLTFAEGHSVTGLWCYDEPTEEWPVGRTYVVRDDNGELLDVRGGGTVAIEPVWLDLNQRDRAATLARAVRVIASAWAGSRALIGAEHDELIKHEHIDYEQPVDGTHARRERRRRCECGELAQLRVTAWAPGPNTEAGGHSEPGTWANWSKPAEYADETVCSADCAENWVQAYVGSAAELLGEQTTQQLRFNLEPWAYEPVHEDLPGVLADAQSAAAAAAHLVQKAARSWMNDQFDQAAAALHNARASATLALARIAELEPVDRGPRTYTAGDPEPDQIIGVRTAGGVEYVNDPIHRLWLGSGDHPSTTWNALLATGNVTADRGPELLPSVEALHPRDVPVDVWLQMAAPLVARILDDPHRYEVIDGGAVVYDRQTGQRINGRTGIVSSPAWP